MPWPKRIASAASLAVAVLVLALVAYQLALARIPERRATLERIVRAQTGLDVRFDELGVRWGWYGPEAVFHRVELGEPGRSTVFVRAPELLVGIDAWATVQSGQLKAGRIVLLAPDIDLHRRRPGPDRDAGERAASPATPATAALAAEPGDGTIALRLLQRWDNGRIELEDGTLRLADPAVPGRSLTLLVRRAWLRRSGDDWSVDAAIRLPDRLGRTARLVVQLHGALDRPATLRGTVRFEGRRLEFAGWRSWAEADPWLAHLPLAGSGDLTARLSLRDGRVAGGEGSVAADGVAFAAARGDSRIQVGYVSTAWTLARRGADWRVDVRRLRLGATGRSAQPTSATVVIAPAGDYARFTVAELPAATVAAIAAGWTGVQLGELRPRGVARDLSLSWDASKPEGARLALSATVDDVGFASASGFAVDGLAGRLGGSESALLFDLQAAAARVQLAAPPAEPLADVQVATRLRLEPGVDGWTLSTDRLAVVHPSASFTLAGRLAMVRGAEAPVATLEGRVQRGDVDAVRGWLATLQAPEVARQFARLASGRIVAGRFAFDGSLADVPDEPLRGFSGALQIEDAVIEGEGAWPSVAGAAGRLEWKGASLQARLASGTGSGLQLADVRAEWRAGEPGVVRAAGRASGRVEDALAWLRSHPELAATVPPLQELDARGDVVIDFDVPPAAPRGRLAAPRITAFLERVSVGTGGPLPPLQQLRGTLDFDGGLRRSTLTGTWLGGPVTLRLADTRGAAAGTLALQAQGWIAPDRLDTLVSIDPSLRREGSTPWQGSLDFAGAAGGRPATGVLRVGVNERLRAVLGVQHGAGGWALARGALRFGGGALEMPHEDVLQVSGRVDRLDLAAWLAAWRSAGSAAVPATRAALEVGRLELGGRGFDDVALRARRGAGDDAVVLESSDLAGVVRFGAPPELDVHLSRLRLANLDGADDPRRALASLGANVRLAIDELEWNEQPLGRLAARIAVSDGRLQVDDFVLSSAARDVRATAACDGPLAPCRVTVEATGSDAAAVLRDVGLDLEASAANVSVRGDVRWQPASGRPWYAAVNGELAVKLGAGRVVPPGGFGPLEFERLAGTLRLRDGQVSSDDLHLDGPAEVIVRGRAGLVTRDYDFLAWVLRGEDRLPAPVRRFAATPRVAAAWLSLREVLEPGAADRARAVLQVRGSWDDPVVERLPRPARPSAAATEDSTPQPSASSP